MSKWRFSIHPAGGLCLLAGILFLPFDRLLAAAAAIVLHEGAHLLAMALCGVKRISIEWTPLGFVAQAGSLPLLPIGKRFCIAAAGLAASATGAAVCVPFAMQHRFAYELLNANLSIGLLNSLPVLPLDGSRILLAAAAKLGVEKGMAKILLAVSYAASAAVCALGLYSACCGMFRPVLCVLGPYLAYAAWRSARESCTDQLRRLEERNRRAKKSMYPAQVWVSVGEPEPFQLLHALGQCPEEKDLILHRLDPSDGRLHAVQTEKQLMSSLVKEQQIIGAPHGHSITDVLK